MVVLPRTRERSRVVLKLRLPWCRGSTRRALVAACAGAPALIGAVPALATDMLSLLPPTLGATELYASAPRSGLALGGYDLLSFYLDPAPRAGRDGHDVFYAGLAWRFATEANRSVFARDPGAYLPRLGAYDAFDAANGDLVASEPDFFALQDARLYFFRTAAHRDAFRHDPTLAAQAEARWPTLQVGLIKG